MPAPRITPESRGEEHGSYIIEALETGRTYRGHFNIPNRHHITNLQDDCIVEIPGYVDRTGIHSPVIGNLPMPCAATCAASVRVQEMGVKAAVRGDVLCRRGDEMGPQALGFLDHDAIAPTGGEPRQLGVALNRSHAQRLDDLGR